MKTIMTAGRLLYAGSTLLACLIGLTQLANAGDAANVGVAVSAGSGKYMAPLFDNLGAYHRQVSTDQPMAQRFFDQGMTLFYGFEWNEAIRSFREAIRLDPLCAPCHWGLAIGLAHKAGPLDGSEYAQAKAAIDTAGTLKGRASPVEQALIEALALRYRRAPAMPATSEDNPSCHPSAHMDKVLKQENSAYMRAMRKIMDRHPQDLDVKVLYGAAVFWAAPLPKVAAQDPNVGVATAAVQEVVRRDPTHAGAHHYLIHLAEAYPHRSIALPSADALRTLVPGAEHLVHMPSHIYFLLGRYHEATESNIQAVAAFRKYEADSRAQGFEPEINFLNIHDQDFLRTSAAMEGRRDLAIGSAREITAAPFPDWLEKQASLQWYIPIGAFEMLRFGMWDEVLKMTMPEQKHAYATGMWHYAQGMASAQTSNAQRAREQSRALQTLIAGGEAESMLGKDGHTLLKIAQAILTAKIADSDGNSKLTLASLRDAMKLQDGMRYHEPPDWYFPVTQALGDAYLKWGSPDRAAQMYRKALDRHPENGWSLFGLAASLRATGKSAEAAKVEERFRAAWQNADIARPVSLF